MERYKLTEEQYKLLKSLDLEEMEGKIKFNDELFEFETNDVRLLLIILNEIIACDGMDKEQENCTEYGRKLYDLHDTILYS